MGSVRGPGSFISPESWLLLWRDSVRWHARLHFLHISDYTGWQVSLLQSSSLAAGPLLWVPTQLKRKMNQNICKFLSCKMYNLIQPGFLTALILKLACDWLSWVFPCFSNIPFQFGHIILLGDSGPDNCMSQPFCAVWQYTGLLFFQLFGQYSCFCGLKSTSRILQSLFSSGLVPIKRCRCIWWALSQRTENMPACT